MRLSRALMLLAFVLPLGACFSYSEAPAPVVVTAPPPTTGTVVVQPQTSP